MNDFGDNSAWLEMSSNERVAVHGSCSIGRSPSNHFVLAGDRVSRRHAIVHVQGEYEHWLVDLGSSNGTYLNGRRICHPLQLRDQDAIQIAGFVLTFHQPGRVPNPTSPTLSGRTIADIKSADCWLLIADIEGSTRLAQQLSPEELPVVTGLWFSHCQQAIETHGGTINKYLGDGFLAYWLAAEAAPGLVLAALGELRKLQAQAQPRFRVVLHYGQVFLGGMPSLGEESLYSSEVNFVFRMEKLAGSLGQARLLSEPAHVRLKDGLTAVEKGRHALSGFEGQYRFFGF